MSTVDTRRNLVKISTASHVSGIRVETLRAWDKRGQLEPVQRVGNTRYYTPAQVERMKSLNTLIQSGIGYSIGELCVKSDDEIRQLVSEFHATPGLHATLELTSTTRVVVAGWRLVEIRDVTLENEQLRTAAPNIDDIESFLQYLRRLEHDGLDIAVVELPSTWDLNYINELREQIDSLNHPDCHVIAVSFLNDPSSFHQYEQEAQQKGVSLLDGTDLTWDVVLNEIRAVQTMRHEATDNSTLSMTTSELARLSTSTQRIAGVAVADIVDLYQRTADMRGLAQREIARQLFADNMQVNRFVDQLHTVHGELADCLALIREVGRNEGGQVELDNTKQ